MLKLERKFSISPSASVVYANPDMSTEKAYPVIGIQECNDEDEEQVILVLIADDVKEFHWIDLEECFLASVDD